MSQIVATTPFHSAAGDGTATVYGPDNARTVLGLSGVVSLGALSPPSVRWGALRPSFGGNLLALEVILSVSDPDGVLDALRQRYAAEEDVWIRLEVPNGRGGSARLDTTVTGVEAGRALAPAVHPLGASTLESRCGLAKLDDAEGGVTAGRSVFGALGDAIQAAGLIFGTSIPHVAALALRPSAPANPGAEAPERVRFAGKFAGSDAIGDNGTAGEIAEALAKTFTLTLFAPSVLPAIGGIAEGARRFYALPRSRVGTALPVTTPSASAPAPLAADSVTVAPADWLASGTYGYLPALGRISFDPTPDVAEARYIPVDGLGEPLADGEESSPNGAFSLSADPALSLRLLASAAVYFDQTGGQPSGFKALGSVRVSLAGADGQTYYGTSAGWQATPAAFDPDDTTGEIDALIPLSLPSPGIVSVTFVGETFGFDHDGQPVSEDALFVSASLAIEDDDGEPVTNVHVAVGNAGFGARDTTLPLMPPAEVEDGGAWQAVTAWGSDVTGGDSYTLLAEATAAERLAQEGRTAARPERLRYVQATLPGLIGPETRVTFVGATTDADSPFPGDLACVAAGLRWDIPNGRTEGLWVEAREGAGASP